MGYAIKRQPLSLSGLVDTDLVRISDATDGLEKRCTLADLSTYVGGGGAANENQIEVYNITDAAYGGVGDGSTDNTAALAAVFTAIGSGTDEDSYGGIIYFPPGEYVFASEIEISDRSQIVFLGNGSSVNAPNKKGVSRIIYSGTAAQFISVLESGGGADESNNFTMQGLDLCYNSSSFSGNLVLVSEAVARFHNCRIGYDYFADTTARYDATGIYTDSGSSIFVDECYFDYLLYGYHADTQAAEKDSFHFVRSQFDGCKTAGVYHVDTGTGAVSIRDCKFAPTRTISGQGAPLYGAWVVADGFDISANVFKGSASANHYKDKCLYVEGTGVAHGNRGECNMGATGIEAKGPGSVDVRGNDFTAGLCFRSVAADQALTGGANTWRPAAPLTGTNIDLSFSGGTVTLTDSGADWPEGVAQQMVTISGATNAANDGTFFILTRPSATTITYTNASGVTESGAADYSIQSRQVACFANTGDTGNLSFAWGPDKIEQNGSDAAYYSYTMLDAATVSGSCTLPIAAQDESENGPNWTGVLHNVVFKSSGAGWVNLTSDYTITPYDNGKTLTNYGASGTITIDIPDGAQWNGFSCYVIVAEAFEVSIEPQGSTDLYVGGGAKTDLFASTKGNQVFLYCGPSGAQWFGNNYGGWSTTP